MREKKTAAILHPESAPIACAVKIQPGVRQICISYSKCVIMIAKILADSLVTSFKGQHQKKSRPIAGIVLTDQISQLMNWRVQQQAIFYQT
jgi:hypothetical protein